jgi:hypothetical protein
MRLFLINIVKLLKSRLLEDLECNLFLYFLLLAEHWENSDSCREVVANDPSLQ